MDQVAQTAGLPADPAIHITIGKAQDCWKTLAALISQRACAICRLRAETGEEGSDVWALAERQIEKPLCCGMLKLTGGWLVSLDSAEMASTEIEVCAEPHRLILLGRTPSIGSTGARNPVVRVLKLSNEVNPESLAIRREGPIIDIELHDAVPNRPRAAAQAA
jgi:hypothetical protein